MEIFQPLADFYDTISDDVRIRTTHISLYLALLYEWNVKGCKNPLAIAREHLMKVAKISARQTYNKTMKELHLFGYITYVPSSNPLYGSHVYLNVL
jgi:hypothetical protein